MEPKTIIKMNDVDNTDIYERAWKISMIYKFFLKSTLQKKFIKYDYILCLKICMFYMKPYVHVHAQLHIHMYVFPWADCLTFCSCISQCSLYLGGHCGCYLKHNTLLFPLLGDSCVTIISQLIANEPTLPSLYIPIPWIPLFCHIHPSCNFTVISVTSWGHAYLFHWVEALEGCCEVNVHIFVPSESRTMSSAV